MRHRRANLGALTGYDMYRIAARVFLNFWPMLLLLAAMIEGLTAVSGSTTFGAELVVGIMLALMFHRAILLGEPMHLWTRPKDENGYAVRWPFGSFLLRFAVFLLPLAVVFVAVLVSVLNVLPSQDAQLAAIVALFPAVMVFPFWGGLVGTMLPAAAVGGDAKLGTALRRAKGTYWITVFRLFAGPILFPVLAIGVAFGIVQNVPMLLADDAPLAVTLPFGVILSTVSYMTPLLTATALSMAYQEAEGLA